MATTPTPNLGNQADAVAKKKITVDLWVVAVIALVANVAGAILGI